MTSLTKKQEAFARAYVELGNARQAYGMAGYSQGVVTLSLFDWKLPTAADLNGWDFRDLSCRSIVYIVPISLNVTMPIA